MKKLIFLSLIATGLLNKQVVAQTPQFQNASFETWTNKTIGGATYSEPQNWFTLNGLKQFGFEETTTKSTISHTGSLSALMETTEGTFADLPGLITINNMLGADGTPNFDRNFIAFDGRPGAVRFWVKSLPETGDMSALTMMITKWNTSKNQRDTIAIAGWENATSIDSFVRITAFFRYFSSDKPDSAFFIASSSIDGFNPIVGSVLYLDDVYLDYMVSGLIEKKINPAITVYPNPSHDKIIVSSDFPIAQIQVIDALGKVITQYEKGFRQIDLEDFAAGMYFLNVKWVQTENKKLIKIIKY